jgi:hypothetical protein
VDTLVLARVKTGETGVAKADAVAIGLLARNA